MLFREKARNLFRPRSITTSSTSSTHSSSSTDSLYHTSTHDTLASVSNSLARRPSNLYTLNEAMARLKYRGTPKPAHTARLQAFQFSSSSASDHHRRRRGSGASQYSPMGTRAPSRRTSVVPLVVEGTRTPSRRNSVAAASLVGDARLNSFFFAGVETGVGSGDAGSSGSQSKMADA